MSKIFKPRRGKASTMLGTKASTVLAAGEMFIELPDTGVGTGICKMKMGDGVTAYSSLPYAMGGDIASTEITGSIVEDTSATAAAALANVTTGRTLGAIVGSLRRACQLNAQSIATLNDELNTKMVIEKVTSDTKTIENNDRGVFYFSVAKTGYAPVGIVGIELSNNWMFVGGFTIESGGNAQVIIHNKSTISNSQTLRVYILYQSLT